MYRLLWFWTSAALLMPCCGLQQDYDYEGDYDYLNISSSEYNSSSDYFYLDNETLWIADSVDQKVVGMGQVTLVLLLGLAVPHVLH